MKTITQRQFVDSMAEMLPELISSIMREDTSAVSQGRISVPQFWALHYISLQEGLTVNELADALHRGKSSTSTLLRRLEKARLVKRVRSRTGQRKVHVTLTARGRQLVHQLVENRKQGIRKTYASLNAEERTRHRQMLEKVLRNIHRSAGMLLMVLFLPSFAQAQPLRSYTLEESIQIGMERSLTVANSERERRIAEARRMQAISTALPTLSGTADYTLNYPEEIGGIENFSGHESKSVGAEAAWQIFAGGRVLSAIRASRVYRQFTAYQERRVRAEQARDIALAYYEAQLARRRVAALSASVRQLTQFEADTRMKYEAGTVSEFDWLSAKVSLANEKPRLMAAENALTLALEKFRNRTFIEDETIHLSDPLVYEPMDIDLDHAIALGLRNNPDLMEKGSTLGLLSEDIHQNQSAYYPRIDLFANYNYLKPNPFGFFVGDRGWQYQLSTGVRARWDLFDGGRRRADVAESRLNLQIAEDEYRDLKRQVALRVRFAWLRGRDAAEVIDATAENVSLAERALEIARSRFDAGLSTHLEVTQANVELSNAQLARSQALFEHMAAALDMKYAAGILLEEYEW